MKKAILAISFGTTNLNQIEKSIMSCVKALQEAFFTWDVRYAFSSEVVIRKLATVYNRYIPSIEEAISKLIEEGYEEVVIQPLHLLKGKEYTKVISHMERYTDKLNLRIGNPLFSEEADFDKASQALGELYHKGNSFLLLLGHGTDHVANEAYSILKQKIEERGIIGTVATLNELEHIERIALLAKKYKKDTITIIPIMLVAGNHLITDILGMGRNHWQGELIRLGLHVEVICQGLGESKWVGDLFTEHTIEVMI